MNPRDSHNNSSETPYGKGFLGKHPIIINVLIIIIVAILGVVIAYTSIAIFTKHGRTERVPRVENLSYTEAINKLHDAGFRVEIRDSLFREDIRPGYVIEQYPKSNSIVKPGRKIFLYINSVHPKEVVIDDDNHPTQYALKNFSERQGIAHLEEMGFKNIRVVKVLGENNCIARVLANGRPVRKMQKVPVNARLIVEVYDGRLSFFRDSLQDIELRNMPGGGNYFDVYPEEEAGSDYQPPYQPEEAPSHTSPVHSESQEENTEMESNSEMME